MTREGFTIDGVECPECGSVRTGCNRAGFDGNGNRIRVRDCRDCGLRFNTVEAPAEFVFNRMDTSKLERDRRRNALRIGPDHEAKRFQPTRGTGWLEVDVRVYEMKPSNKCRRGLHELTPDNVYLNKTTGNRKCRICSRAASAAYRAHVRMKREEREAARRERAA